MANVVAVNTGRATPNPTNDIGVTGIDKQPTDGPVEVRPPGPRPDGLGSGLVGDFIAELADHGGDDQALYAYAREDLDRWAAALGRDLRSGTFGENLTTQGVDVTGARIGERWRIGEEVELEVTKPRIPCRTFAHQLAEQGWIKTFTRWALPGAYLRVLRAGTIQHDDPVTVLHRPAHDVTIGVTFRALTTEPELLSLLLEVDELPAEIRDKVRRRHERPSKANQRTRTQPNSRR